MNKDKFQAILLALMDVKHDAVSLATADCLFECAQKIYVSEMISEDKFGTPNKAYEPSIQEAQAHAAGFRSKFPAKPASDKQKAFARQLGISFEDNVSSYELSKKISEKTGKP